MKKMIVIVCLLIFAIGIAALFWHNEWVYNLPTPVPASYRSVATGSYIDIGTRVQTPGQPLFLHFFNPDCPCSRFNIAHFKTLVKKYGKEIDFKVIVMTNRDYSAKDIQERFDLQIPVSFDTAVALACGVYSTPQAVIITAGHKLYFRGNYNKSRYCTDTNSNYAEIALEKMLHGRADTTFDHFASVAYGCRLPNCKK